MRKTGRLPPGSVHDAAVSQLPRFRPPADFPSSTSHQSSEPPPGDVLTESYLELEVTWEFHFGMY